MHKGILKHPVLCYCDVCIKIFPILLHSCTDKADWVIQHHVTGSLFYSWFPLKDVRIYRIDTINFCNLQILVFFLLLFCNHSGTSVQERPCSRTNFPSKKHLGWRTVSRVTNTKAGNNGKLRVSARECQLLVNYLSSGLRIFRFTNGLQERINPLPPNVIYIYIYMSCRTANLQMLHFKYLFNKYPY
jgi:hypothetical protein